MKSIRCLIVLGMHRSGTSCLTGIVEQYGVYLGDVSRENRHNKKGNQESQEIQALNTQLLALNGGAWNQPVEITRWSDDQAARRDQITASIQAGASGWWGFKDPRVLLTLPFWLEGIDEPNFIGTFRHPHAVAMSLNARREMPLEQGYQLWCAYNKKLLEYQSRYRFPLINFDVTDEAYERAVAILLRSVGLENQTGQMFFDPALRHQSSAGLYDIEFPGEVEALYASLKEIYEAQF